MFAVLLGLLALGVGPVLQPLLRRAPGLGAALDGFVVVSVTGLVLLHVLPQSVVVGGLWAVLVAGLGLAFPVLLHRLDRVRVPDGVRRVRALVTTAGVMLAVLAHALLDGVALVADVGDVGDVSDVSDLVAGAAGALADGHGQSHAHTHAHGLHSSSSSSSGGGVSTLAVAVLLHRLPYGLGLWTLGRARLGAPRAYALLAVLAVGTVLGGVLGEHLVTSQTATVFALVQAFAAGAILHVLLDAPVVPVRAHPRASLAGVVAALAVLTALTLGHPVIRLHEDELHFGKTFFTLLTESAPALLLAFVLVGVLAALAGRFRLPLSSGGGSLRESLMGIAAGLPLPMCSCSVVPVFEGLLRQRAAVAAAVAFLVAAPELGVPSLLLSIELLGWPFALARLTAAVIVSLGVALVVARIARGEPLAATAAPAAPHALHTLADPQAPRLASATAMLQQGYSAARDLMIHTGPWVLLGLLLAAFFEPLLSGDALQAVPRALEIPLFSLVGAPLYVCASGSTPVAAMLLHKGASAGAVLAFLITGPATNVTTVAVLSRALGVRAAVGFLVAVLTIAMACGFALNLLWGQAPLPSLHAAAEAGPGPLQLVSLALLGVLLALALARDGARAFLAQLVAPFHGDHGHVHGPDCGHTPLAPGPRLGVGRAPARPVVRVALGFHPDQRP